MLAKRDRLFIDLLVMGTGEKASLRQRLLGSTIDHVLRHALQPVLSVRDRTQAAYRTMAVATDFSRPMPSSTCLRPAGDDPCWRGSHPVELAEPIDDDVVMRAVQSFVRR
jgi:hypothetical protein